MTLRVKVILSSKKTIHPIHAKILDLEEKVKKKISVTKNATNLARTNYMVCAGFLMPFPF